MRLPFVRNGENAYPRRGPPPRSFRSSTCGQATRAPGNGRFLLSAEARAIVCQMGNTNAEMSSFFARYEAANAIFDVGQIAACYADAFMFGGPDGVQCVKKEDFLKVLPRRKEFFRSRGLVSSNIDGLEESPLDSKYTLVKVIWNMRFEHGASEPINSQNAASYILSRTDDRLQIVVQIDHQDLGKRLEELGLA